jgi:LmbE family N-acetylglucosaminyl deacetylase
MHTSSTETDRTTDSLGIKPGERVGIFAAHPDDIEVMLGITVQRSVAAGAVVIAYIATNGEASTLGNQSFVRSGGRRQEALHGLQRLGIARPHIHLAGFPDGQLPANANRLSEDIRSFVREHHLTIAITLGKVGGDGHSDHVAVHDAVMTVDNLAVWGLNPNNRGEAVIHGSDTMLSVKLKAIAEHASQYSPPADAAAPRLIASSGIKTVLPSGLTAYECFLATETFDRYA